MLEKPVSKEVLAQHGIDPEAWYFTSWMYYGSDKEPIGVDMDKGSRLTQTNIDNLIKTGLINFFKKYNEASN